ncbi:MAG: AAA family ATPase [Nibricoccus sp.]
MSGSLQSRGFLISATLLREKIGSPDLYPFNLPVIKNLETIRFHSKVTFIIGENGSGKSTLIEAIALAAGFNAEGGTRNFHFSTRASHSELYRSLRIARSHKRPKTGFFLRAESLYNTATEIDRLDAIPSFSATTPLIQAYGGRSLHEQSHGESFLALLNHRFGANGLYILDEPEAALSPTRQMAALARMHQLVEDGSQFIIATHSPILMAYPNARILSVSEKGLNEIAYDQTEHFVVTRQFLNNTDGMLRQLLQ